jgi:RND family efflux transporter MFP subunit
MSMKPFIRLYLSSALMLLAAGCSRSVEGGAGNAPPAMSVKVEAATLERVAESTEYIATLKSRTAAVLKPEVEGQVRRIFVRSGDRVKAGTPLLEIDPSKQEATVTSQEANQRARRAALEYNRQELERRKKLFAAGVISRQELEQAETAYEASKAEVEALEAGVREQQVQLRYFTVKAPADGVIGDIPVRVGDRVNRDTELTTLDEGGELEAYISVPAEKASEVRLGTPVEFLPGEGLPAVRASVSFISPRVEPGTQLLLIKAKLPNASGQFRNDQVVHARVVWRQIERPLIPVTAVARMGGKTFAFVAETSEGKTVARQKPLQLGDTLGNSYVVLEGLAAGDKVITSGVQLLADGMPVTPES